MAKLNPIDPKLLKIRSRVELFEGVDKNRYTAIISVRQKSRILVKDIQKFETIVDKMTHYCNHPFHHKKLILDVPLCSKARKAMQLAGWEIADAAL